MTYELLVGGLAPEKADAGLGFRFSPRRGALMEAAALALEHPDQRFLLHIDEINRADLAKAKVLGEAIYLFEPNSPNREVDLPYDFGPPFQRSLKLPTNLYVLRERGRLVTRAIVPAGHRHVELVLATAPMGASAEATVSKLVEILLHPLAS